MFAAGVALAALAGMIAAPVSSVYPGMGSQVLIICFVVVVIGGIGSISGALVASLLVGFVDTFGKVFFAAGRAACRLPADGGDPALAARRAVRKRLNDGRAASPRRAASAARIAAVPAALLALACAFPARRRQVLRRPGR